MIRITSIALFGVSLISTVINIWFLFVVWKCYGYFRDIDHHNILSRHSNINPHTASRVAIAAAAIVVDDQLEIADCIINNNNNNG